MAVELPPFSNHLPVRVRFGSGVVAELAEVLHGLGARRALVVVDPHVAALPPLVRALEAVAGAGIAVVRAAVEAGEPTFDAVDALAAHLAESGADAVVAVGGGSVLDVAKAARLVRSHGGPYRRFAVDRAAIGPQTLPLVTVPTTAGTGSEVTGGAVVADPATHRKTGVASPLLRADDALVDPDLTRSLPPAPTVQGGIDALAQALAAVVVRVRTPVAVGIGLEAARLAAGALPRVVQPQPSPEARAAMACASLMAGLAMNLSEVGAEHSLGHALGAVKGLPHGLTIGLVLAETMEHDRHAVPDRFERVADALGAPHDGSGDGSRAVDALRGLLARLQFPTLQSVGVTEADVEPLVDVTLAGWIPTAPAEWTPEDVARAFRAALALGREREA